MATNYYELLEIDPSMATPEIQRILDSKRAITSEEVDRTESEEAIDRLLLLVAADEVFASEESRAAYDAELGIDVDQSEDQVIEEEANDAVPSPPEPSADHPASARGARDYPPPASPPRRSAAHERRARSDGPKYSQSPRLRELRRQEFSEHLKVLGKERNKLAISGFWKMMVSRFVRFIVLPIGVLLTLAHAWLIFTAGEPGILGIAFLLFLGAVFIFGPLSLGGAFRKRAQAAKEKVASIEEKMDYCRRRLEGLTDGQ